MWGGGAVVLQTSTATPGLGPDELVDYWPTLIRAGWFLVGVGIVTGIGWFVVEPAIARVVRRRNRNNPTIQEAISRYFRLFVLIVALFTGAGVAGYGRFIVDSAIVIAAATLAIGVAAQSVIGSFVSGVVLVIDPEFNVGNYISWSDGEGTVESITLNVTRVNTVDGGLVTIPNTKLTSEAITRPYGRGRYRVVESIALAYEDDIDAALEILETAAEDLEAVRAEPRPRAYVEEFGGDAVRVRVHFWVSNPRDRNLLNIRSTYAQSVKTRLEAAGITISPASKRELSGRINVDDEPGTPS
mgnify:CR=1 FL=1